MSKVYAVAGVSKHKGKFAVRYANSASRAKVLERNGHSDVELFVFEDAMAKEDLIDELLKFDVYKFSKNAKAAIVAEARSLGFIV